MSDDIQDQPEDTVSRAEHTLLQEQLKATRIERDREKFEKSEIVAKANVYAKERDDLRDSVSGLKAERDRFAAEKAEAQGKIAEAARKAEDATRRADEAAAEIARLRAALEAAPSADPAQLLWQVITQQAKASHDWLRARIPADSPMLPWFDKAVATGLSLGCQAVKLTDASIRWATPRVIALFNRGKAELEARLAKK